MSDGLSVRCGDAVFDVLPSEEFSFGRSPSCTLCLDPDDVAISRLAGRLEHDGRGWWIVNASSSRQFATVDEFGLRSVLPPGRRAALEGSTRVLVDGTDLTHELAVTPPPSGQAVVSPVDAEGAPTSIGAGVLVSTADRAALVALFAGYLQEGKRYDPNPKSYAAAAARLGWPRTTLVKRIEYLRARLTNSGVPNLTGPFALNGLAEFVLTTAVITRADLDMLSS